MTDLSKIFSDDRFRPFGQYRYYGEVDGSKIGVVLATCSPRFDNFALNKADLDRLVDGKREGRIDQAFVVQARVNGYGAPAFHAVIDAEELAVALKNVPPVNGQFGPFFVVPPGFKFLDAAGDEPF
jgi:hypothetical protein